MKKLTALLLAVVLAMPLAKLPVYAAGADPYSTVLCSSFDEEISLHTRANFAVTTTQVSAIWPTDYLGFKDLDFGKWGPTKVTFTSGAREGMANKIQLRLDKPDGKLIAEVPVTPINFQTGVANTVEITTEITGVHDLYVTTDTMTADLFSFCFYAEDPDKFTYHAFSMNRAYPNMGNDFTGHAANLLWQLGILTGEAGQALDTKMPVSRAEFADAIYGIYRKRNPGNLGEEPAAGTETKFSDVSADSPYSVPVAYLSGLGVINGVTETEFRPSEYIKYVDAVTLLVRMLGYTEMVELNGGYPSAYLQEAVKLGIYDADIGMDEVLRRGSMAELVFRALQAKYLELVGVVKPDSALYETKKGVLSDSQGVYSGTGIVEATEISALTMPESGMRRNYVMINGETYAVGETDALGLLGIECAFFYELDSKTEARTLRAIAPDRRAEMTEISSLTDEIIEISGSQIVYLPAGEKKEREIKVSSKAYVLYNGVAADSSIEALIHADSFKGTVVVAENTDGTQSVIVNEYADYVIESIDYATGKVTGQGGKGAFTLSDSDLMVLYDENLEDLVIKQLKSGDVLTVYQSKNKAGKRFSRVYLSTDTANGTVTEIDEEDYYIDGKAYRISNHCIDSIKVGQNATFLLNIYGEIVKLGTDEDSALTVGLFMAYTGKRSGLSGTTMLKLMTLEGNATVFNAAQRVVVDGVQLAGASELINGKGTWNGLANLKAETAVRYRLNADGEINLLDTPAAGTNDGSYTNRLTLLNPDDTARYGYYRRSEMLYERSGTGAIKYILPQNAIVFAFFGVDNREENCEVGIANDIISMSGFQPSGQLYSTTGDELHRADLFVWDDSIEHLSFGGLFVVDEIVEQADEEGQLHKVIRGWHGGETAEYRIDENATTSANATDTEETKEQKKATFKNIISNLETGDILRLETKPSNTIRAGQLWLLRDGAVSRETGGEPLSPVLHKNKRSYGSSGNLEDHLCFGSIIEKYDNYIVIDTGNGTTEVVNISIGAVALVFKRADGATLIKRDLTATNLNVGDAVIAHVEEGYTSSIVVLEHVVF